MIEIINYENVPLYLKSGGFTIVKILPGEHFRFCKGFASVEMVQETIDIPYGIDYWMARSPEPVPDVIAFNLEGICVEPLQPEAQGREQGETHGG